MGPRHLSRGIPRSRGSSSSRKTCFNGATASEPWNQREDGRALALFIASMGPRHLSRGIFFRQLHAHLIALASMGPRHLSRGIVTRGQDGTTAVNQLQWGHGI